MARPIHHYSSDLQRDPRIDDYDSSGFTVKEDSPQRDAKFGVFFMKNFTLRLSRLSGEISESSFTTKFRSSVFVSVNDLT